MSRTEAVRRSRWSKRRIRALAWISGVTTLTASGAAIASIPPGREGVKRADRPVVVERHVIRRIVIIDPPSAAPAPAPIVVVAAPPAPALPATNTGGS